MSQIYVEQRVLREKRLVEKRIICVCGSEMVTFFDARNDVSLVVVLMCACGRRVRAKLEARGGEYSFVRESQRMMEAVGDMKARAVGRTKDECSSGGLRLRSEDLVRLVDYLAFRDKRTLTAEQAENSSSLERGPGVYSTGGGFVPLQLLAGAVKEICERYSRMRYWGRGESETVEYCVSKERWAGPGSPKPISFCGDSFVREGCI